MNTNEFFERVVYLNVNKTARDWGKLSRELSRVHIEAEQATTLDPATILRPPSLSLTNEELAEILSFYKVIQQAAVDRISRLLILGDKIKPCKGFLAQSERVYSEMPHEWEMVYFGHHMPQPVMWPLQPNKLVHRGWNASGTFALAINNTFYNLFLDRARVPIFNLNESIRALCQDINLFLVIPPLFLPA